MYPNRQVHLGSQRPSLPYEDFEEPLIRFGVTEVSNLILQTYDKAAFSRGMLPWPMTLDRLQMHLFYCQGISYAQMGTRMYSEDIYATANSVIIPKVSEHYGNYSGKVLTNSDVCALCSPNAKMDLAAQRVVFQVLTDLCDKTDRSIHKMITAAASWQAAKKSADRRISRKDIKREFAADYWSEREAGRELDLSCLSETQLV